MNKPTLTSGLRLMYRRSSGASDRTPGLGGMGKPAPDLFLATAAAEGVAPAHCLVIEDSVHGAAAARAAGMDCLGLVPHGDGASLRAAGAVPFRSMHDLPELLRVASR